MVFDPDIIVTEPGLPHVLLIVEAKARESGSESDRPLRNYMWRRSCPVGLLASPQHLSLYRNLFTEYSDDSVEKVGVYPSPPSWKRFIGHNQGSDFESRVQTWLEGLKNERSSELTPEGVDAFEEFVIPSLLQGEIRAAGPRVAQ